MTVTVNRLDGRLSVWLHDFNTLTLTRDAFYGKMTRAICRIEYLEKLCMYAGGEACNDKRGATDVPCLFACRGTFLVDHRHREQVASDMADTDEDAKVERESKQVFVSVLSEGGPTISPYTTPAGASQAFHARVQGKRVTLANLDRERPAAKEGTLAHRQVLRRNARLLKRETSIRGRRARDGIQSSERSRKPLSRRQRKLRGLEQVDEDVSYESLSPVHDLWLAYIHRLMGLVDADGKSNLGNMLQISGQEGRQTIGVASSSQTAFQNAIVKADFVGAPIRVVRAKNPSLVGIEGLVAKETESTFVVAQQSPPLPSSTPHKLNLIKTVPKSDTVFTVQVTLPTLDGHSTSDQSLISAPSALQFSLHGNQLRNTLPTRATKKFKARKTIELG